MATWEILLDILEEQAHYDAVCEERSYGDPHEG
jgi:hypothetical protein